MKKFYVDQIKKMITSLFEKGHNTAEFKIAYKSDIDSVLDKDTSIRQVLDMHFNTQIRIYVKFTEINIKNIDYIMDDKRSINTIIKIYPRCLNDIGDPIVSNLMTSFIISEKNGTALYSKVAQEVSNSIDHLLGTFTESDLFNKASNDLKVMFEHIEVSNKNYFKSIDLDFSNNSDIKIGILCASLLASYLPLKILCDIKKEASNSIEATDIICDIITSKLESGTILYSGVKVRLEYEPNKGIYFEFESSISPDRKFHSITFFNRYDDNAINIILRMNELNYNDELKNFIFIHFKECIDTFNSKYKRGKIILTGIPNSLFLMYNMYI